MKLVYQIGWQELAVSILGIYAPILFVIIAFLYVRFMRKYKNSNDPREKYRPIMEKSWRSISWYCVQLCILFQFFLVKQSIPMYIGHIKMEIMKAFMGDWFRWKNAGCFLHWKQSACVFSLDFYQESKSSFALYFARISCNFSVGVRTFSIETSWFIKSMMLGMNLLISASTK